MFQDQHISNLCFLIDFHSHLFQPYVQRKKLHLRGTMHLENNYYYFPLLALGFEAWVDRCTGCSWCGWQSQGGDREACFARDGQAGPRVTAEQQPPARDAAPQGN